MPREAGQLYSSREGERQIDELYSRTLAGLPFPAHELMVRTPTFGEAHVTVAGKQDRPLLMMWHGGYLAGPHTLWTLGGPLGQHFRIYAPDMPCHGERALHMCLRRAAPRGDWGTCTLRLRVWRRRRQQVLGLMVAGARRTAA